MIVDEDADDCCNAYARHMDDLGRETVVSCAKVARHRGQHYDDRLNVHWSYADEMMQALLRTKVDHGS
jgi:hypothetical protein